MRATELALLTLVLRTCDTATGPPISSAAYTPTCSTTAAAHPDAKTSCVDDVVAFIGKTTYEDIQDAIDDASRGDEIYICPGEHEVELKLSSLNVTLAAASGEAATTTLSGGGSSQVLSGTQANLSVYNLTFSDGSAYNGGAVGFSQAELSLSCVTFSGNTSSGDGGAIDLDQGILTLDTVTFDNNTATGDGGAVRLRGSYPSKLVASDSTFTDNSASSGGALALGEEAQGDRFTLSDCELDGNTADDEGGAILLETDGYATLTVADTIIRDNEASSGGGVALVGDAMEYDVWFEVTDFDGNTADSGAAIYANSSPDLIDLDFYQATILDNVSDDAAVEVSNDTIVWSYESDWGDTGTTDDNTDEDLSCDCGSYDDLQSAETFLCTLDGKWVTP